MTKTLTLHPTDIRTFQTCRLQWWFSSPLGLGYTPKLTPRHFVIGRLFHRAVEAWHAILVASPNDYNYAGAAGLAIIESEAEEIFNDPDFKEQLAMNPLLSDDYADDIDLLSQMFENFTLWAPGRWRPLEDWIERRITKRIRTPNGGWSRGVITGKVDGVVEYRGHPWILELKTAGRKYGVTADLEIDLQMGTYLWLVRDYLPDVKGVLRVTAYKTLPKMPDLTQSGRLSRRNITTTAELLVKACREYGLDPEDYREWIDDLRGRPHPCFEIMPFERSATELEILERRLYNLYMSIRNPVIYPHAGLMCRWCDFAWPCKALNRGSDYHWILEEGFKKNERD